MGIRPPPPLASDPLNGPLNNKMKDPLLRLTERPIDPPTELNLVVKNVSYVNLRAVKTDREH